MGPRWGGGADVVVQPIGICHRHAGAWSGGAWSCGTCSGSARHSAKHSIRRIRCAGFMRHRW